MKQISVRWVCVGLILAGTLSACTSHYEFTTDMATFVQRWNGDVNNDALKLKYDPVKDKTSASTESGVITVVWVPDKNQWMAIGDTVAVGALMCTNLLYSATSMDYSWADTTFNQAEAHAQNDAGSDTEGNVRFSISTMAGAASCTVEPAPVGG